MPPYQHGGDRWYNVRSWCLCFRAAAIVHRHREAGTDLVATACGISRDHAYQVLMACARKPHLYHLRRIGPGRFASVPH
jgi:hypothetical protein